MEKRKAWNRIGFDEKERERIKNLYLKDLKKLRK